jgi:cardiolipin synthase
LAAPTPPFPGPSRIAAKALCALLIGGCASLPERASIAHAGPVRSNVEWVQKVDVRGADGPLGPRSKARLLAEGASPARRDDLARHLAALELNVPGERGQDAWQTGNQVKLLIDGPATLGAMFQAIEGATQSVLLESYILEDDEVAQQLATLLKRKAAQGVKAVVIYDGVGSIATSNAFFDDLKRAGVPSCAFNPVNPLKRPGYWGISHRDHRKILAVDGHTAFTGGINISRVYASSSFGRGRAQKLIEERARQDQAEGRDSKTDGWRDTQIQIRGPAAQTFDTLVRDTWRQQGCQGDLPPTVPYQAPPVDPKQHTPASLLRVLPAGPDDGPSRIYTALLAAIEHARESVQLTMAYFAPGREMLDALEDAARRGVKVQLVLPSISDFSPVLYAGRATYTELLEAGVELYELQDALLHAKTGVVDGVWSTVGSSNMDWRSFVSNNEANIVVLDEGVAGDMQRAFAQDVSRSQRITREAWRGRGVLERAKEWGAGLFSRWF